MNFPKFAFSNSCRARIDAAGFLRPVLQNALLQLQVRFPAYRLRQLLPSAQTDTDLHCSIPHCVPIWDPAAHPTSTLKQNPHPCSAADGHLPGTQPVPLQDQRSLRPEGLPEANSRPAPDVHVGIPSSSLQEYRVWNAPEHSAVPDYMLFWKVSRSDLFRNPYPPRDLHDINRTKLPNRCIFQPPDKIPPTARWYPHHFTHFRS